MLAALLAALAKLRDYTPGFTEWLPLMNKVLDTLGTAISELFTNKADADHTHGAGGQVMGIGDAGARPALVAGFLHSEPGASAEAAALVMLNADGTARAAMVTDRAPLAMGSLLPDDQASAESDMAAGALRFANGGAWAWGHFKAWMDGAAWRFLLEAMMTTASASVVDLAVCYQVFGPDDAMNPVKTRRANSTVYAQNALVIPDPPNGHCYKATTGGTSAASPPTFNTGSGSVTTDGTVVWTEQGAGMKSLTYSPNTPAGAYDRFDIGDSALQIPPGEVSAGDRVHFGLSRGSGDAHAGDLLALALWVAPVEA